MRPFANFIAGAILALASGGASAQNSALIPRLERLADAGNAEAIYHLGMAYHIGAGVPKDHAKALEAFQKAAALGDPLGSYKLGCYYDGQGEGLVARDQALALKYKLAAANAGYALAQQDVGALYARSGNLVAGRSWVEKSAAQGWPQALMIMSSIYNGSAGVERDAAKMDAYFRLFIARSKPSEQQTKWLADFEQQLSAEDKKRADEIVAGYRPAPTGLTLSALSGQRAAEALVEGRSVK